MPRLTALKPAALQEKILARPPRVRFDEAMPAKKKMLTQQCAHCCLKTVQFILAVAALAIFTGCPESAAWQKSKVTPTPSKLSQPQGMQQTENVDLFALDLWSQFPFFEKSWVQPPPDPDSQHSNLTKAEAISIAKEAAKREGFHLEDYYDPDAWFRVNYGWRSRYGYWTVGFESKISVPVGRFGVIIDDQTRATRIQVP